MQEEQTKWLKELIRKEESLKRGKDPEKERILSGSQRSESVGGQAGCCVKCGVF